MSTPKEEQAEIISQNDQARAAVRLLDGFTPTEKLAILYRTHNNPTAEAIRAVSEDEWRSLRNIGAGFVLKLAERGLLGEQNRQKKLLSLEQRVAVKNAERVAKIDEMISRARYRIAQWEQEKERIARSATTEA